MAARKESQCHHHQRDGTFGGAAGAAAERQRDDGTRSRTEGMSYADVSPPGTPSRVTWFRRDTLGVGALLAGSLRNLGDSQKIILVCQQKETRYQQSVRVATYR